MTVCNMSIEAGARPDRPRRGHLRVPEGDAPRPAGRRVGPSGGRLAHAGHRRGRHPSTRRSSSTPDIEPFVSWGTNPGHVRSSPVGVHPVTGRFDDQVLRRSDPGARAWDLSAGTRCARCRSTTSSAACNQRSHRGPAGGRGGLRPPGRRRRRGAPRRPWLARGQGPGRRPRASTRCSAPRVRLARAGLLHMCLAMNPDKLAPASAAPHLEPQLRGDARAADAPTCVACRRRCGHRHRRALPPRRPRLTERITTPMDAVHHQWHCGGPPRPLRRRPTRSSPATGSPSRSSAPGFDKGLSSEWRDDRDFSEPGAVPGRQHPDRRTELRHRLEPATRGVGHPAVSGSRVVSPRFGDIFRNNSTKNGLVPVQVSAEVGRQLLDAAAADPTLQFVTASGGTLECDSPASVMDSLPTSVSAP